MESFMERSEAQAGRFAFLLVDDVPSTCQQKLCGEIEWDLRISGPPPPAVAPGATGVEASRGQDRSEDDKPKKKHKSQRRIEKEKEFYDRQHRMQENQKAKAEAMKRTACRFFQMGKCKEGATCRFGHF